MGLFDDFARTDVDSGLYAEPLYRYLNRTARPPFQRIRELLEKWVELYPEFAASEWVARFRSENDRQHVGAFYELYCRALLGRQGFRVDREPLAASGSRRVPDFLVRGTDQPPFLLECALASGPDFGSAEMKRINRVYDTLNRLESRNFFVGIQQVVSGAGAPPARRLRSFLDEKLKELDPDRLTEFATSQGANALPHWRWADRDWEIILFPIPKKPEARSKLEVRPLGIMMTGAKRVNSRGPLLDALERKASRYGRPDVPYVIAVDALDLSVDDEDIVDTLFGEIKWAVNMATRQAHEKRVPNGFWCSSRGPQHKRVSAVLFARHVFPHSVATTTPMLWHNPWADHPLDPGLWQGPQMVADAASGKMVQRVGKEAAEILGLSQDWPEWSNDVEDKD